MKRRLYATALAASVALSPMSASAGFMGESGLPVAQKSTVIYPQDEGPREVAAHIAVILRTVWSFVWGS